MPAILKPPSRAAERRVKKAQADLQKRAVYRRVDERDGYRCRCCGRPIARQGGLLNGGHHHEIRYRSLGGPISTANCVLLASACHADVHAGRLIISGDADGVLTFERRGKAWTS